MPPFCSERSDYCLNRIWPKVWYKKQTYIWIKSPPSRVLQPCIYFFYEMYVISQFIIQMFNISRYWQLKEMYLPEYGALQIHEYNAGDWSLFLVVEERTTYLDGIMVVLLTITSGSQFSNRASYCGDCSDFAFVYCWMRERKWANPNPWLWQKNLKNLPSVRLSR